MSGPMAIRFFISELTRQVPSENITEDPEWASIIPKGVRDGIDGQRTQSRRDYQSVIPALPRKGDPGNWYQAGLGPEKRS